MLYVRRKKHNSLEELEVQNGKDRNFKRKVEKSHTITVLNM